MTFAAGGKAARRRNLLRARRARSLLQVSKVTVASSARRVREVFSSAVLHLEFPNEFLPSRRNWFHPRRELGGITFPFTLLLPRCFALR